MGVATLNRSINRPNLTLNGLGGSNPAAVVRGLGPAAWFRFGIGITVTGAGVSTWADQSGNGRDLLQGTDSARPALQADGSILFDGAAHFLKCSAFTLNAPVTVYMLGKPVTWVSGASFFDGNSANTAKMVQTGSSPQITIRAASTPATVLDFTLGSYAVGCGVFNGASSVFSVNNTTSATVDVGAGNPGGFTLGANGAAGQFSNIQAKEVILYAAAHDAGTRARVIRYLSRVGQLGV